MDNNNFQLQLYPSISQIDGEQTAEIEFANQTENIDMGRLVFNRNGIRLHDAESGWSIVYSDKDEPNAIHRVYNVIDVNTLTEPGEYLIMNAMNLPNYAPYMGTEHGWLEVKYYPYCAFIPNGYNTKGVKQTFIPWGTARDKIRHYTRLGWMFQGKNEVDDWEWGEWNGEMIQTDISASSTDITSGSTSLSTNSLYLVYE